MTALKLVWRMQRWELAVLIGGAFLFAGAAAFLAWQIPIAIDRLEPCTIEPPSGLSMAECRSRSEWAGYLAGASTILQGATTVVPFAVGILLGAPLVSREIEKRTAPMAWSLSRSRSWWLAGRTVPLLVLIVVVLLLLGQATEAMILAVPDMKLGWQQYAMHGPLVAARGMTVFLIGVVVGLVMGRVLPAVLVSGLIVVALLLGLQIGRDQLMRAEAVWVEVGDEGYPSFGTVYDSAFRDGAAGDLVTFEEASIQFPDLFETGPGIPPGMTQVYLTTPVERYPIFVAREMGALLIVTLAAIGLALVLVQRRGAD